MATTAPDPERDRGILLVDPCHISIRVGCVLAARWYWPTSELWFWFLLASALVGTGARHQAMHRMDAGHLLQVVPAAIICASLLASE